WRARGEDVALEHTRVLELEEARCERPRRYPCERLLELVEADSACLRRRPHDRERPAPPEQIDRTGDLLGQRLAVVTPHGAGSASARARGRALRRASSPGGNAWPRALRRGRRRDRPGSARG